MLFNDAVGTTRTSAEFPVARQPSLFSTPAEALSTETAQEPIPPPRPRLRLSEGLADFMRDLVDRDTKPQTLNEYRKAIWLFVEFVACDPPTRELPDDTLARFLSWLKATPIAPRKPWSLPKTITPAAVEMISEGTCATRPSPMVSRV